MQEVMAPKEILALLKEQPFEGIRICVSDGESYVVRHPDMVLVTDRRVFIAKPPMKQGVPAGSTAHVDPLQITRIEPLTGNGARPKRRS